jgi:hypothetical protein
LDDREVGWQLLAARVAQYGSFLEHLEKIPDEFQAPKKGSITLTVVNENQPAVGIVTIRLC